MKQGEQVTERRLVRPLFPLPRWKLHFVARERSTEERMDVGCPTDDIIVSSSFASRITS